MAPNQRFGKDTKQIQYFSFCNRSITLNKSRKKIVSHKKISIDDLEDFDISAHLDSPETIAAYLTDILSSNDPALLAAALGDIARAKGMSEVAKCSGITREALYKALRNNASPRFETVSKVCSAFGVKLVAQAMQ